MKQKKRKEFTAPAKKVVELHIMHAIPKRTFRFIVPERIPAYTPSVEYERLNANEDTRP